MIAKLVLSFLMCKKYSNKTAKSTKDNRFKMFLCSAKTPNTTVSLG